MTAIEQKLWQQAWALIAEIDHLTITDPHNPRRLQANDELAKLNEQIKRVKAMRLVGSK
jgi:hypothetical protein